MLRGSTNYVRRDTYSEAHDRRCSIASAGKKCGQYANSGRDEEWKLTPVLWPGATTLPDSVLTNANSFKALPLFATAAVAAACFLLLACAAAAICRSRTVEASERESSCAVRFAGGMLYDYP